MGFSWEKLGYFPLECLTEFSAWALWVCGNWGLLSQISPCLDQEGERVGYIHPCAGRVGLQNFWNHITMSKQEREDKAGTASSSVYNKISTA